MSAYLLIARQQLRSVRRGSRAELYVGERDGQSTRVGAKFWLS
jgi:hypothetical protein